MNQNVYYTNELYRQEMMRQGEQERLARQAQPKRRPSPLRNLGLRLVKIGQLLFV